MKNTLIVGAVVVGIGIVGYFFFSSEKTIVGVAEAPTVVSTPDVPTTPIEEPTDKGTPAPTPQPRVSTVIGSSVEDRDITAYHFGTGEKEILFVGGIHGGYSWNTSQVAYELIDYLKKTPHAVPKNLTVTVIPVLNPDGLYKVTGKTDMLTTNDIPTDQGDTEPGRFNAHTVDLNRNFDCDWQSEGTWQQKKVSGGARAFSEPESQAIRDYVTSAAPEAVIVWYSSAGGVYASNCHAGVLSGTQALLKAYADASGYPSYNSFDYYEITGDMVNWLAKMNIPAISVLLTNHTDTEWEKNRKGIEAVLKAYGQ